VQLPILAQPGWDDAAHKLIRVPAQRRQINAVQDSTTIHLKRLQKKGGRDSVTDARLDNCRWPNDSSQRVTEPGELDVTVMKGAEWRVMWQCLLQ
jgi:hypothetical protein